jgi:hypothetical protein
VSKLACSYQIQIDTKKFTGDGDLVSRKGLLVQWREGATDRPRRRGEKAG